MKYSIKYNLTNQYHKKIAVIIDATYPHLQVIGAMFVEALKAFEAKTNSGECCTIQNLNVGFSLDLV